MLLLCLPPSCSQFASALISSELLYFSIPSVYASVSLSPYFCICILFPYRPPLRLPILCRHAYKTLYLCVFTTGRIAFSSLLSKKKTSPRRFIYTHWAFIENAMVGEGLVIKNAAQLFLSSSKAKPTEDAPRQKFP